MEKTIIEYESNCRPMHFKKRAEKILAELGNEKDAIQFIDKIIEHVDVSFKEDIYRNRYLYWCKVKSALAEF